MPLAESAFQNDATDAGNAHRGSDRDCMELDCMEFLDHYDDVGNGKGILDDAD